MNTLSGKFNTAMLYNRFALCCMVNVRLYLTILYDSILNSGVCLFPCSLNDSITFIKRIYQCIYI